MFLPHMGINILLKEILGTKRPNTTRPNRRRSDKSKEKCSFWKKYSQIRAQDYLKKSSRQVINYLSVHICNQDCILFSTCFNQRQAVGSAAKRRDKTLQPVLRTVFPGLSSVPKYSLFLKNQLSLLFSCFVILNRKMLVQNFDYQPSLINNIAQ